MSVSKLIAGLVFVIGGVLLGAVSFFSSLVFLIYSLPMIFLGVWLLVDRSEDGIEQRQDLNKTKTRR